MNDETTEIKELTYLVEQFTLLRADIKEITQKMGKIEKRIAASFPQYKALRTPKVQPPMVSENRESVLQIYEDLLQLTKNSNNDEVAFSAKLKPYSQKILAAVAVELGIPGGKRMTKKEAVDGIKSRIRESILLS